MITERPAPIVLTNVRLLAKAGPQEFRQRFRLVTRAQIKALRSGDEVLVWDTIYRPLEVRIESRKRHRFVGRVVRVYPKASRRREGKLIVFHACNIVVVLCKPDPKLTDVRQQPESFNPPSRKKIRRLLEGDGVLLGVGKIEFAVEVLSRRRAEFVGRVIETTPFYAAGQQIGFHETNIIDVFCYGAH
jgi:hypothetical protein